MLNSFEIERGLNELKLINIKPNERIKGFATENGHIVYIKTSNEPNTKPVNKSPLLISPVLKRYQHQINDIEGIEVSWGELRKNSNINKFSINGETLKGSDKSAYAVNVKTILGLKKLIGVIDPHYLEKNNNLLDEIAESTAKLPIDETTRKTVIDARIGQGPYRASLISVWGSCAVTETVTIKMLKASHIKPWKDSNNSERLDKFNGLLLSANLDSAFDSGLISFEDTGEIILSSAFTEANSFSIHPEMTLKQVFEENKPYLAYHRKNVFQGTQ